MTLPRSVADVLKNHVTLEVEGIDLQGRTRLAYPGVSVQTPTPSHLAVPVKSDRAERFVCTLPHSRQRWGSTPKTIRCTGDRPRNRYRSAREAAWSSEQRGRVMRDVGRSGRGPGLTWGRLVVAEPRLASLLEEVRAARPTGGDEFKLEGVWGQFKDRIAGLVGWHRRHGEPLLRTQAAYVAKRKSSASFDRDHGANRGGWARCREKGAWRRAARHAAKYAELGRTQDVA